MPPRGLTSSFVAFIKRDAQETRFRLVPRERLDALGDRLRAGRVVELADGDSAFLLSLLGPSFSYPEGLSWDAAWGDPICQPIGSFGAVDTVSVDVSGMDDSTLRREVSRVFVAEGRSAAEAYRLTRGPRTTLTGIPKARTKELRARLEAAGAVVVVRPPGVATGSAAVFVRFASLPLSRPGSDAPNEVLRMGGFRVFGVEGWRTHRVALQECFDSEVAKDKGLSLGPASSPRYYRTLEHMVVEQHLAEPQLQLLLELDPRLDPTQEPVAGWGHFEPLEPKGWMRLRGSGQVSPAPPTGPVPPFLSPAASDDAVCVRFQRLPVDGIHHVSGLRVVPKEHWRTATQYWTARHEAGVELFGSAGDGTYWTGRDFIAQFHALEVDATLAGALIALWPQGFGDHSVLDLVGRPAARVQLQRSPSSEGSHVLVCWEHESMGATSAGFVYMTREAWTRRLEDLTARLPVRVDVSQSQRVDITNRAHLERALRVTPLSPVELEALRCVAPSGMFGELGPLEPA